MTVRVRVIITTIKTTDEFRNVGGAAHLKTERRKKGRARSAISP